MAGHRCTPPPPPADVEAVAAALASAQRLAAVRATGLLDSPAEDVFDRLTRLATRQTGAPVSALTLLDEQRDFYKSQDGFIEPLASARQFAGQTFCQFCLLTPDPLVIDDVSAWPGYRDVPTVQSLGIRSYLGVPLINDERQCIGTLCVLDFQPHHWTELDVHLMSELALSVMRELALRKALAQAQAASLAKSNFLANMSHEIRTPMNAILGFAHLLSGQPLSSQQGEQLARIRGAGEHLMSLLNDILDVSKIEAGRLTLEDVDFSLRTVVDEVIDLVSEAAHRKQITLRVDLKGVPNWLRGDPTRIRQALLNLASNAVKFTEQGEVNITVTAMSDSSQPLLLHFAVRDSGIGLSAEQQGRLFQAFSQADESTTRTHGGTGLGLLIVRRIAELMGGSCGVDSAPGAGSNFWFTARLAPSHGLTAKEQQPPRREVPTTLQGLRVLLAEDHPINQEVARALLGSLGLDVEVVASGQEAVETMARRQDIALILMDVQMPGMDGLEATRLIRQIPHAANVPIVAMTANAFEDDRQQCLAAGMNDFLTKPVEPARLLDVVSRWAMAETQVACRRH